MIVPLETISTDDDLFAFIDDLFPGACSDHSYVGSNHLTVYFLNPTDVGGDLDLEEVMNNANDEEDLFEDDDHEVHWLCNATLERTYHLDKIVIESIVVRGKLCGKKKIKKLSEFKDYILSKLDTYIKRRAVNVEKQVFKLEQLKSLQESIK